MKKITMFFVLALFTWIATAQQTVVDIIVNSPDHNTLETAVIEAGLAGTLSGEGPFTVFAPTDDAFDALPDGVLESLLDDPEGLLTEILLYHVVGANALSTDLSDGQIIETLNGESVVVTINDDGVFINDAQVTVVDLVADNGVVHVINAVLIPPADPTTVVDIILASDIHTTLATAVAAAGLVETLQGEGPFTVFAPTDAAFDALPDGTLEALLDDPSGLLTDILLYHVVGAQALSTDLSDGLEIETLNGATVTVTINDDGVFINDAQVIVADLVADNGVVHVIDAVLLPAEDPFTVVDIILASDIHTTLATAVAAAGLVETLQGEGPFTVFAPTDAAFDALPDGTLEALLDDPSGLLTDILLYHVVGAQALSTDLSDGQTIETLLGETVTVTINDDGVFINDAQVIVADLIADNGVVHVIDAVLLPPANPETVADIILSSDIHLTLSAALDAANLIGTLSGEGPFTVFAPTDAAFDALPDGTLETLLEDPSGLLTDILLYHVVGAQALSTDLSDGLEIETLNGATVTVTINDDGVFINDAQVIVADLVADNGVVHVIDAVLLPPAAPFTVVDIILESDIHTVLATAVAAAGLVETLQGDGPFTVFAPTDAAFDALPDGLLEALLDDPDGLLTQVLLYHVVGGQALSTDLSDGLEIETLNGQSVTVTINDDGIFINDAQVIVADLIADNGVVHVIDAVLTPEIVEPFTVVDVILQSDVHTTLATAVAAAGLVETLQGEGPFTVFAPTDEAFDALPDGVLEALLDDPDGELTRILLYHVVGGLALSTDLEDGQLITTILGQRVVVTINDDGVFINDAQVTVADIIADNGVVHVIDAVLLPEGPATVMDIIAESTIHNALRTALEVTELDDVLRGDGPFTVFAPTDAAFMALPPGLIDELLQNPEGQLTQILLYHVIGGRIFSSDLEDGQMVVTVQGQEVTITINDEGVFVNDAEITVVDLEADNGVVHVIDAVLLPEQELVTIYEIISTSPVHTTLTTILDIFGLEEALTDPETELTVFAPTDDAFAALGQEVIDELLSDPYADLLQIIRHHLLGGTVLSTDLSDGLEVEMASGQTVTFTINDDGVFIDDAQIIVVDLIASNGVVHVIDAILLPEITVCDIGLEVYQTFNSQFGGAPQPDAAGNCESFSLNFSAWASEIYAIANFAEGVSYNFSICEGEGAGSWDPQLTVIDQEGNFVLTVEDCEISWVAEYTGAYFILINEVGACGPGSANTQVNNGVPTLTCQGRAATVMDIIENSEVHTTLTAAINAADLNATLRTEGPFTVFAPTDAAFGALDPAVIEALLADPAGDLTQILLYHVTGGRALSTDLSDGQTIVMLNEQEVTVTINAEGVFINDAQVIIADLEAENGVVHVIDAVLIPEGVLSTRDIADAFPGVQVYPNPTSSTLFIDLQAIDKPIQRVRMIDMTGRTIDTYIMNAERREVSVSQMPTGAYFLEFMIDGNIYFKKLLINR